MRDESGEGSQVGEAQLGRRSARLALVQVCQQLETRGVRYRGGNAEIVDTDTGVSGTEDQHKCKIG